jgi:anti-sigma regulatory factor (Ser/Thr protein kinase)
MSSFRPKAVVFGVENVLIGRPPPVDAAGKRVLNTRWDLLHRMRVDPKNDPLAPLLKDETGAPADPFQILKPLLAGENIRQSPEDLGAWLYQGCQGSKEAEETVKGIQETGIKTVIWDNSLVGTTDHLHLLIDRDYPGLFPRSGRFFSSELHASIGEDFFLELLLQHLKLAEDEILFVTSGHGYRDYALRRGMKTCLFRLYRDEGGPNPLLLSLVEHLQILGREGTLPESRYSDPVMYHAALRREFLPRLRFLGLSSKSGLKEILQAVANEFIKPLKAPSLKADLRSLWLDRLLYRGMPGDSSLADELAHASGSFSPLPSFKSLEEVRENAAELVEEYLRQTERGIPSLAKASFGACLEELEALYDLDAGFLKETGIIGEIAKRLREHIVAGERLYVEETGVLRPEEWKTLVQIFTEGNDELDQRHADWVNETFRLSDPKIARERLVDNLILRIIELEMRGRCVDAGLPRSSLFPQYHDAKNRAGVLVSQLDNPAFWKNEATSQVGILEVWVRGVMGRMARAAGKASVKLRFNPQREQGASPVLLNFLSETEKGHLDDILTELIVNALKYKRRESREPSYVRVQMIEKADRLEFQVSDNGIGIQDVEKVWEPGIREHPDRADGEGGGLAAVMQHVQEHGWSIEVRSEVGVGSAFTLMIPRKPASAG